MTEKLNRYDLEYDKALVFSKKKLSNGNTLSIEILKSLNFEKGQFFTLLPENTNTENIYNFSFGGLLLQNKINISIDKFGKKNYFSKTPTIKKEISQYIYEKIESNNNYVCVFEDVQTEPTDPHLDFFQKYGLLFLNEVYYFLNQSNATQGLIFSAIKESDAIWHHLFIITEINKTSVVTKQITLENITEFCKNIKLMVLGAYDGENFIFWEPNL